MISLKHCVYFVLDYFHKVLFYKDAAANGDRGGSSARIVILPSKDSLDVWCNLLLGTFVCVNTISVLH